MLHALTNPMAQQSRWGSDAISPKLLFVFFEVFHHFLPFVVWDANLGLGHGSSFPDVSYLNV